MKMNLRTQLEYSGSHIRDASNLTELHRLFSINLNRIVVAWDQAFHSQSKAISAKIHADRAFNAIDAAMTAALSEFMSFCEANGLDLPPQHQKLLEKVFDENGEVRRVGERTDD